MPPPRFGKPKGPATPGPKGSALLGVSRQLANDPLGFFVNAAARHGDVVRLQLGPTAAYMLIHLLRHPRDLRHVLIDNRTNYVKPMTYDPVRAIVGNGLVTSDGEDWKQQRRVIQPLFHRDRLHAFDQLMIAATEDVAQRWVLAARANTTVPVASEMNRLTLDIVGRAVFSADLATLPQRPTRLGRRGLQTDPLAKDRWCGRRRPLVDAPASA